LGFVIFCVFIALMFALTMGAVVYAVNKSNHDFYTEREDAATRETAALRTEVQQLKGQVAMLMGMINPKDFAVAP
jgi:uncharacterized protein HemX